MSYPFPTQQGNVQNMNWSSWDGTSNALAYSFSKVFNTANGLAFTVVPTGVFSLQTYTASGVVIDNTKCPGAITVSIGQYIVDIVPPFQKMMVRLDPSVKLVGFSYAPGAASASNANATTFTFFYGKYPGEVPAIDFLQLANAIATNLPPNNSILYSNNITLSSVGTTTLLIPLNNVQFYIEAVSIWLDTLTAIAQGVASIVWALTDSSLNNLLLGETRAIATAAAQVIPSPQPPLVVPLRARALAGKGLTFQVISFTNVVASSVSAFINISGVGANV